MDFIIKVADRPPDATGKVPANASYVDKNFVNLEVGIETLAKYGFSEGLNSPPELSVNGLIISFSAFQCYTITGVYCSLTSGDATHETADASNPRIDIITVDPEVQLSGGEIVSTGKVEITKGTAAANPIIPATPPSHFKIAEVDIAAGSSTASIRNWRPSYLPFAMLRAKEQPSPDMTLKVNFFRGYLGGNVLVEADAQDSPEFSAPASGKARIDVLHIDNSGTLSITQGTVATSPTDPTRPDYPENEVAICEVLLQGGETAIYQSQIKDVRPIFGSTIDSPATDGLHHHQVARATYDFSEHGGSQGDIGLGISLPDNAIVVKAWYEVLTTLESNTDAATIAIGLPTDDPGGIFEAVAISDDDNPWDSGNYSTRMDPSEKTTASREITVTIANEDVTAGKFIVWCEYVVSD